MEGPDEEAGRDCGYLRLEGYNNGHQWNSRDPKTCEHMSRVERSLAKMNDTCSAKGTNDFYYNISLFLQYPTKNLFLCFSFSRKLEK
jgi:hypothetical protein